MVAWHAGKSIKYLGIHINMHRDWDAHWEEVVGEIRKDLNTLRRNTISCAEAKYVIDTRVRGILQYTFANVPVKEAHMDSLQRVINGIIKGKMLVEGVDNEMMWLPPERLGLGMLDVKGMYREIKVAELLVKLNDPTVVGSLAKARLEALRVKWGCEKQPFQYEELTEYNQKNRDTARDYMAAAYMAARRLGVRVVTDEGEDGGGGGRQTIQEVVHEKDHMVWKILEPAMERNGLRYVDQIIKWDEEIERWRMMDWGDLALDNARPATQDPGWWGQLCAFMCRGNAEGVRGNVITDEGMIRDRAWIRQQGARANMRDKMPQERGGGGSCVNASDGSTHKLGEEGESI